MFIKFEENPEQLYRNNGIEIIGSFKEYEDLLSGSARKIEVMAQKKRRSLYKARKELFREK